MGDDTSSLTKERKAAQGGRGRLIAVSICLFFRSSVRGGGGGEGILTVNKGGKGNDVLARANGCGF